MKWKSEAAKTSRMLPSLKRKVRSPCLSSVAGHLNRLPGLFSFNPSQPNSLLRSRLFPAFGRVPSRTFPTSPGVNEPLDEYFDCSGLLFGTKMSSNFSTSAAPEIVTFQQVVHINTHGCIRTHISRGMPSLVLLHVL